MAFKNIHQEWMELSDESTDLDELEVQL